MDPTMSRFDIGVSIALCKENGNFQRRMSGQLGKPACNYFRVLSFDQLLHGWKALDLQYHRGFDL